MTTIIDGAKALELIDQAIAHRGEDFTYPKSRGSCFYHTASLFESHYGRQPEDGEDLFVDEGELLSWHERGDQGACLVGYILLDLLDIDPLYIEEDQTVDGVLSDLIDRGSFYTFTDEARGVLAAAQATQDSGKAWREARAQAGFALMTLKGD